MDPRAAEHSKLRDGKLKTTQTTGGCHKDCYRVLCIVFFFMCVAKHASALVVCGKRRTRKTINLSARQTDKNLLIL